jgi:transposase
MAWIEVHCVVVVRVSTSARLNKALEALDRALVRIDALESEVASLKAENAELRAENEQLKTKVSDLESKLAKSQREGKRQAAPFRRRKRKPKSQHKKPGQEPGHDPSFRAIPDKIDEEIFVPLGDCCDCGGQLGDRRTHDHYVTDIPAAPPITTKFVTESGCCVDCGQRWNSSHDALPSHATGAAGVMIGNRTVALAAQMRLEFGAPLRKIAGFISSALGLPISAAGVLGLLERASRSLEATCDDLKQQLQDAPKVCSDETGWRVASESAWAWVFTNDDTTFYTVKKSRGHGVVLDLLGKDFEGILQSDCFLAYLPLPYEKSKCIAHILKSLKDLEAFQTDGALDFPRSAINFFKDAIELEKHRFELEVGNYRDGCFNLEKRLDRLLEPEYSDPKNAKLAKRIEKYRDEWLVFLYNVDVEATNNLAERQIRPFVLIRKISAGNRSEWGALVYTQLMSVFSTCKQRGQNFLDTIVAGLIDPTRSHLSTA